MSYLIANEMEVLNIKNMDCRYELQAKKKKKIKNEKICLLYIVEYTWIECKQILSLMGALEGYKITRVANLMHDWVNAIARNIAAKKKMLKKIIHNNKKT